MNDYPELETTIANLKKEQNSEPLITKVIKWLRTDSAPTASIYSTGEEQKYLKQFRRLFAGSGILYRRYFAHNGKMFNKQLCLPKTVVKGVVYTIHNAPTGEHLRVTRTIEEFRKRFYCPNYVELVKDFYQKLFYMLPNEPSTALTT